MPSKNKPRIREMARNRYAKNREEILQARRDRKAAGLCARCDQRRIGNSVLCAAHKTHDRKKYLQALKHCEAVNICQRCRRYPRLSKRTLCASCRDIGIAATKVRTRRLKQRVLDHYGQKCNCTCGCQVTNFRHLTIDHINNDGAAHRAGLNRSGGRSNSGHTFYSWIINNGFPDDLQILCCNCNCAKQWYGGCTDGD